MSTRTRALIVGAFVLLVGGGVALDALIITDEERVREFAEAVASPVDDAYWDRIEPWIDLETTSLEVVVRGESRLYDGDEPEALRRDARRGLAFLQGTEIRTLSRSLEIEDERSVVQMRLFTGRGVREVTVRMRKNDESWVVERVHVM